ncbi:MAG: amidohydrolase family protein [Prosthecobacter sp.]|uniref:amidohydrolase family protein n=1 Tax=Prosthecobacter sp. TaxID=1965333 RepID=UPI0025F9660C|nr:amidohydrolase family protein [Prosthecobacter sp.]MCF7787650.1 amidohydrolase family protein [Prosthecobacter sp.]
MIIDVHSHAWNFPSDFSDDFIHQAGRARPGVKVDISATYEAYRAAAPEDTRTFVFGGKAKLSGLWVNDQTVADYVARDPARLIGFLSIDPTQENWQREMQFGHETLGLRGIKLLPMYAGFSPDDPTLEPLWQYAEKHSLPVLLHMGTTFIAQAPLAFTLPRLIEPVALKHPGVKIILAHLGHPYEGECLVTIRKHDNVFADVSALHYRPWQLYNSLMLAQEYGVWHKLLFGTDFPFTTVNASIDGIRKLNDMLEGTKLPRLDLAQIEAMIHRDSLNLLGLNR